MTGFSLSGFGNLEFGHLGFGHLGFCHLGFGHLGFGHLGFGHLGLSHLTGVIRASKVRCLLLTHLDNDPKNIVSNFDYTTSCIYLLKIKTMKLGCAGYN